MAPLNFVIPALAFFLAQGENRQFRVPDLDHSASHYDRGLSLARLRDFAGAEKEFRAALKLRPHDAEAHYNLGLTLIANPTEKLDWSGAKSEFRAAAAAKPDYMEARRMWAECLLNTGDPAAAAVELEALLKEHPTYTQARFSLACALDAAAHPDRAAAELRRVVTESPALAEAHAMLGKLLGSAPLARHELETALRLNPDLAGAHLALGRLLRDSSDARSVIEFAQGQRLARRNADAIRAARLSNQGLEAAAHGNLTNAVTLLRQTLEIKPDYAPAHYNLGLLLADSDDLKEAATELRTAASLAPALAKPWYNLGRVLERSGDPSGALGALDRAAHLDPEDNRAESLAREIRAQGIIPIAPPVTPDTPAAHAARGVEQCRAGDWLGGAGEFLRAIELRRDFAGARYNLAIAMYHLHDRSGAEFELRKVTLVKPDAAAHYALAVMLQQRGDPEASTEFEIARQLDPSAKPALDLLRDSDTP